ncbi:MAG: hypothetical protein IT582_07320 [Opitutaceae bacterium]|nr:hypothetical protein [Opitutaceae bacterium]
MTGLASLFPAADYQFRMTMRRDRPEEFFLPRNAELLRERARWVGEDPKRYALLQPEFGHLLAEAW